MKTLYEVAENPSGWDSYSNYMGEVPSKDWLVLLGHNRDSDILTESNWACALELLGGESETVEIFRFGHWACGWLEYLCVKSGSESERIAADIESQIEDYPILDENHFSELEQSEADSIWHDCYSVGERVEYIRENRDQFDFNCWSELRACIRGEYFVGYASELLS